MTNTALPIKRYMRAALKEFHEYVMHDILGHIPNLTSRAMFGGYGLYQDGRIFGIITDVGELRFKVDDTNRAQYEAHGSTPFVYTGHKSKKPTTMQYYLVPEEITENKEIVTDWVFESASIGDKKP